MRKHDGVQDQTSGEADTALVTGEADVLIGHQRDLLALNLNPLSSSQVEPPVGPDQHALLVLHPGHHPLHLRLLRLQVVEPGREGELWVRRGEDDIPGERVQETEVVNIGDRDPVLADLHPGRELVPLVGLERHAGVLSHQRQVLPGVAGDDPVVFVDVPEVGVTKELDDILTWTELDGLHSLRAYPEDIDDDEGGDEVPESDEEEGEVNGPEEVGITLLLDIRKFLLRRSCQFCRANWLAVESEASPRTVRVG